jgi:hypothetical protein
VEIEGFVDNMVNYYFEWVDGGRLRYLVDGDLLPAELGADKLHGWAYANATRWWIENANGVTELRRVESAGGSFAWRESSHDPREFMWIKLRSRAMDSLELNLVA